jgi:3-oxoacyl-[acyl-carrier protein] reductase
MKLRDHVALVTGGSRGIGRALCLGLAAEGARVVVNYATRREGAEATVRAIEQAGGQALAMRADVASATDVEAMVRAATERFGTVDVLVNNAAVTDAHKPWQQISEAEWDRVLAVNLKGCFLCLRAVYPFMQKAGWGRIINVSSVTFWLGRPNLLHYVSSKAGMIGFTRTLAREVGADGITVNALTPGAIQTEAELELFPDQAGLAGWLNEVQAIRRRGTAQDVVGAVVFLASDDSSFITGQTINVDGGWAMH